MMMATGPALIRSIFPPERLGRGLGLIGVATSLGLMTGPVVSGLLLRWVHWRAIFLVTVPVGILFYFYGSKVLGQCGNLPSPGSEKIFLQSKPFDLKGSLLWAGSVSLTILLATHVTALCCGKDVTLNLVFGTGIIFMLLGWFLFFRHEARCPAPILPLELFRQRFFSMAMVSSALSFAVLFFVIILIPFYLDRILGFPPDRIGYVMMAVPLSIFIVSPLAGRLHDLIGARIVATTGLVCCLGGMVLLTGLDSYSTGISVGLRLALMGFGQAMFLSPNSASALAGVTDEHAGLTSSLLATARNVGMLAGTALAGLSFALHFASATGGLDMRDFVPEETPAFLFALKRSFQYGVLLSAAAVIASWLRQPGQRE
jgi:predicted MFS family arabinose efflux permease